MTDEWAQLLAAQNARNAALAANPVSYIKASMKDHIRTQTVIKVSTLCHAITSSSGNGTTNHWTLFFDVGNNQGVHLDLQPDASRQEADGKFQCAAVVSWLEDSGVAAQALRRHGVAVERERTVGWYVDYLVEKGRYRYLFTPDGVGCRWWISDTLQLMGDVGEFDDEECTKAREAIARSWPDGQFCEPAAGTYF